MIKRLVESTEPTLVQQTAFTHDVLGRYICNTWDEAVNNGGPPFDAVVIGAGMYGAYIAEKVYRQGEKDKLRVLVLEAGNLLVTEHVQNLARIGLNAPGPVTADPGVARNEVWGLPWRSQTGFPGLAYCVGGRSLYWGGWAPRLTHADLSQWPTEVAQDMPKLYGTVEREIGVAPGTDFISGPLYHELKNAFSASALSVPTVDEIEEAPLAVQGNSPASGLFSFDKYSSAPLLVDAIREAAASPDSTRRLFLVPRAHVVRLHTSGSAVTQIEADVNGQRRFLNLASSCAVVLALSTIESTRLALESFPTPLMGRNLMGHLRSNLVVRIKRSAFSPSLPKQLEAAALLARGSTPQGRYHLQVTGAAVMGPNSEATMFRMIPDLELLDSTLASQQADWIVITLRGIGEMQGNQAGTPPDTSWMDLSPFERDEFGVRRAWINLAKTPDDELLWKAMDEASLALAQKVAKDDPNNIEYLYNGVWNKQPPAPGTVRDGLGTTHHEAGTLWIGAGPDVTLSVTNADGCFHHIINAYVAGPALFPTIGSANPALTAFALARRTASAIVSEIAPALEEGFESLFAEATLAGWQMAGSGRFNVAGRTLESEGGIGLLWHTQEEFSDFVLKLDWRASSIDDNSGVFLRFPALGSSDPANDWRPAVDQGYEVQIDDRGFDPAANTTGSPRHQTGAIYNLAPSSKVASRPVGQWNTFEIEARGHTIKVKLNGELVTSYSGDGSRPLRGHIGIQNHHTGSRVAFKNIRIQKLAAGVAVPGR